jgi:hypothetical protein
MVLRVVFIVQNLLEGVEFAHQIFGSSVNLSVQGKHMNPFAAIGVCSTPHFFETVPDIVIFKRLAAAEYLFMQSIFKWTASELMIYICQSYEGWVLLKN